MMKTQIYRIRWLAIVAAVLLAGCGVAAPAEPTLDVKSLATQIAADVFAAISQTQEAQQATQQAEASPTNTAEPPTLVPTFTETPGASTATLAPTAVTLPSSTPAPIACNAAQLVADVTVADDSLFSAGAKFTKTWRVKNVGSCTWVSGYRIRFTDGTNLAEKSSYPLPAVVKPGESVDISVDMSAPNKAGTYRSSWSLVSDKDVTFGIGVNAKTAVYAQIKVQVLANPAYEYDFAANVCAATWRSATGVLPCTGTSSSTKGFVILQDGAKLENRTEDELLLWVHPNNAANGFIRGTYPAITISSGDRFVAWVGCLADNKNCNVRFRLDYINPSGNVVNLGKWPEIQDGSIHQIDIDLSALDGKKVQFILTMEMRTDNFTHANGFWFLPSIR